MNSNRLTHAILRYRWQSLSAAALLVAFASIYFAAFWVRFEGEIGQRHFQLWLMTVGWFVAVKLLVFGAFRMYQAYGRFVTFHDLVTLVKAASVSSLCLVVLDYAVLSSTQLPRSVLLLDWGMTILLVGGLQSASRLIHEGPSTWLNSTGDTRILIVGTNNSGEALLRAIRRNQRLSYRVVGFVSERASSLGTYIGGVPVLGTLDQTCQLALRHGVSEVLITAGELSGLQVRQLVEDARDHEVVVKVLPSYEQLLHGQVDLSPRTVSIEDLLQREPVELNVHELNLWIDNRVLLVTGSAGSIGSEICRQLLQFRPRKLVVVDRNETGQFFLDRDLNQLAPHVEVHVCLGDATDAMRMNQIFQQHRPDIVFHAAAYKHVPLMESHPGEAVKNIALATRLLADLAHQNGVSSFVLISTDKSVNPTSVMGTCKRVAELYVQSLAKQSKCRFVTVRFGNVLDSAGSVIPIFRQQIARGGPVTVTHPEMKRFFMTIPEASQLVIQAGAMGQGGEIFVLDMGQPVRIVDLAKDMIRLSGLNVGADIDIRFVGVRPGERLDEILHGENEKPAATTHPKILVAQSAPRDRAELQRALESLQRTAGAPREAVLAELQNIVREYQPQAAAGEALTRAAA